jgi:preprotein translocase subunit SecB
MAQSNAPTNGQTAQDPANAQDQVQVRVINQYVKDLSFENPNVLKLLNGPGENPGLKLEVNVNAKAVGENLYESAIDLKAMASNAKIGTIYNLEIEYGGMFEIRNMPQQALEPFLLINCPALLFPFLRRLAADLTREGGFPPLLLDPVDFAGLYMRRQQEQGGQAGRTTAVS